MEILILVLIGVAVLFQLASLVFMKATAWYNEQTAMWNASTQDYRAGDLKTGDQVYALAEARAANPPWYVRLERRLP